MDNPCNENIEKGTEKIHSGLRGAEDESLNFIRQ